MKVLESSLRKRLVVVFGVVVVCVLSASAVWYLTADTAS